VFGGHDVSSIRVESVESGRAFSSSWEVPCSTHLWVWHSAILLLLKSSPHHVLCPPFRTLCYVQRNAWLSEVARCAVSLALFMRARAYGYMIERGRTSRSSSLLGYQGHVSDFDLQIRPKPAAGHLQAVKFGGGEMGWDAARNAKTPRPRLRLRLSGVRGYVP
jgi:hypothetical protein